jgi:hypothetical protein
MNTSYFRLQNKILDLHHGLLAVADGILETLGFESESQLIS